MFCSVLLFWLRLVVLIDGSVGRRRLFDFTESNNETHGSVNNYKSKLKIFFFLSSLFVLVSSSVLLLCYIGWRWSVCTYAMYSIHFPKVFVGTLLVVVASCWYHYNGYGCDGRGRWIRSWQSKAKQKAKMMGSDKIKEENWRRVRSAWHALIWISYLSIVIFALARMPACGMMVFIVSFMHPESESDCTVGTIPYCTMYTNDRADRQTPPLWCMRACLLLSLLK